MKRLDLIALGIFNSGKDDIIIAKKGGGWPGYYIIFRPSTNLELIFGKMTIDIKRKTQPKEQIKELCINEIKSRLLDTGRHKSGLRRLLSKVKYKTLYMTDDFNKELIKISGYTSNKTIGITSDFMGAIAHELDVWEIYCGYRELK